MSLRNAVANTGWFGLLHEGWVASEYLNFSHHASAHARSVESESSGRPVLLIPGFMAGDVTLYPLANYLKTLGHKTLFGGIWCNADCPRRTLERLGQALHKAHKQYERKVVVIGHSLGGIYARELARRFPNLVERAMLLGSPLRDPIGSSSPYVKGLAQIARLVHGSDKDCLTDSCELCGLELPNEAPEVPETIIYSRTDGVVRWQNCIETGPAVEVFEVMSTHCGLPFSLEAVRIITDRLHCDDNVKHRLGWRMGRASGRERVHGQLRLVKHQQTAPSPTER